MPALFPEFAILVTNILVFTAGQAGNPRSLEAPLTESVESITRSVDLPPHCSPALTPSPSPSPVLASPTGCHPSSPAFCMHGTPLLVCSPPCRQSELPTCQSDAASPLLGQLHAVKANPRAAGSACCLSPSPAVLSAPAPGPPFHPWNVQGFPRPGLWPRLWLLLRILFLPFLLGQHLLIFQ